MSRPSIVKKNTSTVEPLRERPKTQPSLNQPNAAAASVRSKSPGRSRPAAQIKNTAATTPREKSPRPQSRNNALGAERTTSSSESPRRVSFNNDATNKKDAKPTPVVSKPRPTTTKSKENAPIPPVVNKKSDSMEMKAQSTTPEIPKVVVSSTPDETKLTDNINTKANDSSKAKEAILLTESSQHSSTVADVALVGESSLVTAQRDDKNTVSDGGGNHSPHETTKSESSTVTEASDKSLPDSKSPILTRPVTVPEEASDPKSKHSKIKFKFPGRSKEKSAEKPTQQVKTSSSSSSSNAVEVVTNPKDRIEVCIDKALNGFAEVHRNLQRHVMSKLQGEVELNTKKPATLAVKTRYHRLKRLEGIMGELHTEISKICNWMRSQEDLPDEVSKSIEQGLLKIEYIIHEVNKLWSSVFSGTDKSIEDKMNGFHDLLDRLFTDFIEFVRNINQMKVMRDNNKRIPISNDKMAEIGMSFPMKYIDRCDEKKKH